MDRPFEQYEVKVTVFQTHDNSSLGPDGFNSKFFKLHWDLIKNDVFETMVGIQQSGKIIKEINHTFICLIPESVNPHTFSH